MKLNITFTNTQKSRVIKSLDKYFLKPTEMETDDLESAVSVMLTSPIDPKNISMDNWCFDGTAIRPAITDDEDYWSVRTDYVIINAIYPNYVSIPAISETDLPFILSLANSGKFEVEVEEKLQPGSAPIYTHSQEYLHDFKNNKLLIREGAVVVCKTKCCGIFPSGDCTKCNFGVGSLSKEYVWAFYYNSCVHESASAVVSLHKTEKGAEMAMGFHKNEAKKEFDEMYSNPEYASFKIEFGAHESWFTGKIEIQE